MESQKKKSVEMVLHSVGNMLGHVKGNYAFFRDTNKELTKEIAQEMELCRHQAITQLEDLVNKESGYTPDEEMLKFMAELRVADWSTEDSVLAFYNNVFRQFTRTEETEKLRDSLFRNPLK